jgi:nitrate/TMAO reductase-like tetraheme cytochrome c subunit
MNCWNCHYYGPNIQASINYQIEHSAAKAKEKKKSSAQKARDGLKNLPHNRKAMRY